jgi:hypothetical protein
MAYKLPPQIYTRSEAMSDRLHAIFYNPFFLTDVHDAAACLQVVAFWEVRCCELMGASWSFKDRKRMEKDRKGSRMKGDIKISQGMQGICMYRIRTLYHFTCFICDEFHGGPWSLILYKRFQFNMLVAVILYSIQTYIDL